jgi:hypothetical protein
MDPQLQIGWHEKGAVEILHRGGVNMFHPTSGTSAAATRDSAGCLSGILYSPFFQGERGSAVVVLQKKD